MSDHLTFPVQARLGVTVEGSDGSATAAVERHMNRNDDEALVSQVLALKA